MPAAKKVVLTNRAPESGGSRSPGVGTTQVEAALFADCFAAVRVKFSRTVGAKHGWVGSGFGDGGCN